jgi:hypothetical protein
MNGFVQIERWTSPFKILSVVKGQLSRKSETRMDIIIIIKRKKNICDN